MRSAVIGLSWLALQLSDTEELDVLSRQGRSLRREHETACLWRPSLTKDRNERDCFFDVLSQPVAASTVFLPVFSSLGMLR